ncbi:MAG: hypothetical protein OFPI_09220 [Osedax symbiont Rs2]|nr:MAG: hypothetical protein OFPI_09220 [Osedax symbiont Rs2]
MADSNSAQPGMKLPFKSRLLSVLLGLSLLSACSSALNANDTKVLTLSAKHSHNLDPKLDEISGLATSDDKIWGINDSGGEATLYAFDPQTYQLIQSILLPQTSNSDWEDLAQDKHYIYVADTGNNFAIRQRLNIYKVPLAAIQAKGSVWIASIESTQKLTIEYADRQGVLPSKSHNFDSEALTVVNDKLWLFSKNRADSQTKLYKIDREMGEQLIAPVASYPVGGLITAADYSAADSKLLLLGYSKRSVFGHSFVWVIDVKGDLPDWASAIKYKLFPYAQWESIKWQTNQRFLVAAEESALSEQKIAQFTLP